MREKFVSNEAYFLLPDIPTELKNLQQILEAFVLFKTRTYNDLKLVVLGGKNHKNLKQALLAINEKFPATVVITGPIPAESLAPLYGAAVAAIYFAEPNSLNLPVLEAQQCACPIIVLSAEKEPYSWVAGSTRRVVPGKVEELFEALVQVYHDVETRKELIHLGYQNAGNFTWEKSLEPVMTQMQKMVNALNNAGALL